MTKPRPKPIQSVKGMHDILPEDQKYWQYILKKANAILQDYAFDKIDTPLVESSALFLRTVGDATDIIDKEMYTFKVKGGEELALRPEITASVVRAYLEHGMNVLPHPVKLWYYGPVFRHDNPQAGRYRQFHQLGVESFGDDNPAADVEMIALLHGLLYSLGLKNISVRINTLGDQDCRPAYLKALKAYYSKKTNKVCAKCNIRFKKNLLRLLDCQEEQCKEIAKDAPQMVNYLCEECHAHFKSVLEFLDEIKIPYNLDSHLVRGLDYYTRTIFEIWPEEKVDGSGLMTQIAGGGRYDKLVELLGGHKTPAVGWALGMERLILILKENNINVPDVKNKIKVFLAQLGDTGKKKSFMVFEELRKAGIPVKATFGRDSIKSQLRIAHRLEVKYTLIMGQKEALEESIILREMKTGAQENVPITKIVDVLKQRLKNA